MIRRELLRVLGLGAMSTTPKPRPDQIYDPPGAVVLLIRLAPQVALLGIGLPLPVDRALGEHLGGVLWTRSRSLAETTAGGETELVWGEAELPERLR